MLTNCADIEKSYLSSLEYAYERILSANGMPINSLKKFNKIAKEQLENVKEKMREKGFPENFKKIVSATSKKEVKKLAKVIIIQNEEIALMAANAELVGFKHYQKHPWFFPDDVLHTEEEKKAFSEKAKVGPITDKKVQKFVTKVFEQVKKRKRISVHLLEKEEQWHIFYFSWDDMYYDLTGDNHYKEGPHIHYISYLFGKNFNKYEIWKAFDNRKLEKINSIHIKLEPTEERILR